MKILYRHHRGSLDESMKTLKEFNNYEEMKEYVIDEWKYFEILEKVNLEITIEKYSDEDKRINWKPVNVVMVKIPMNEYTKELRGYSTESWVAGFCTEKVSKQ